jgi:hypothetical protein
VGDSPQQFRLERTVQLLPLEAWPQGPILSSMDTALAMLGNSVLLRSMDKVVEVLSRFQAQLRQDAAVQSVHELKTLLVAAAVAVPCYLLHPLDVATYLNAAAELLAVVAATTKYDGVADASA